MCGEGNKLILCSSINRGESIKYDWVDTMTINGLSSASSIVNNISSSSDNNESWSSTSFKHINNTGIDSTNIDHQRISTPVFHIFYSTEYSDSIIYIMAVLCIYFLLFSLLIYANWTSFNHNNNDNDKKSRKKRKRKQHKRENNNNNNNVVNGNNNQVIPKPKFHLVNFFGKQTPETTTTTLSHADYNLIRIDPMIIERNDHHHNRPFGLIYVVTTIIPNTIKSSLKRLVTKFNQRQKRPIITSTDSGAPPDNHEQTIKFMDQYSQNQNRPEFI
uniref:GATA zinc finger domain-containing protein 8-like isoform X2 n=1 Tax=Dermatophagoides pteronyssinus TaxID=6956 RepID=A0A6P6XUZ9_DERPT|nr:GATA zinc finger domain-containing protein 8-like isoform X2 [Dermatophagoides pteronyssinus]